MIAREAHDLSAEYLSWLRENLVPARRGNSEILSTPFLDPFNDGIEIVVEERDGEFLFHDAGKTIENLLDMGVQIERSERRQQIIRNAIAGCGVRLNGQRLEISTNAANRAQRLHFLVSAILRLNDLWMTSSPRSTTDFFEMVKEFFDEHDVLYTANKSISGRTVEHPIDFIVPLPKGRDRLIKLISRPTLQAAKVVSFTWVDIQDVQPEAERVVLINDIVSLEETAPATLKTPTDNVVAILKGYSHKLYSWSEALNDPKFVNHIARVA